MRRTHSEYPEAHLYIEDQQVNWIKILVNMLFGGSHPEEMQVKIREMEI